MGDHATRAREALEQLIAELEAEGADADQWKDRAEKAEAALRRIREMAGPHPFVLSAAVIEVVVEVLDEVPHGR